MRSHTKEVARVLGHFVPDNIPLSPEEQEAFFSNAFASNNFNPQEALDHLPRETQEVVAQAMEVLKSINAGLEARAHDHSLVMQKGWQQLQEDSLQVLRGAGIDTDVYMFHLNARWLKGHRGGIYK